MVACKLAPSILTADFARLGEQIGAAEQAGVEYIHVDVMDGHFVPNITIGPLLVGTLKRITGLPPCGYGPCESTRLRQNAWRSTHPYPACRLRALRD